MKVLGAGREALEEAPIMAGSSVIFRHKIVELVRASNEKCGGRGEEGAQCIF